MEKKSNISSLFDPSGNLTIKAMEMYVSGKLEMAEMEAIRKHLEVSSFDREALEGMQKHGLKDIAGEISELNKQIQKPVKHPGSEEKPRISYKTYWSAAAGIILIAGLSIILFFIINDRPLQNHLAINKPSTVVDDTLTDILPVPDPAGIQNDVIPVSEQDAGITGPEQSQPETKKVTIVDDDVVVDEQIFVEAEVQTEAAEEQEILAFEIKEEAEEEISIFMVVEQMPEFPGGEDSLNLFIKRNLTYPMTAVESGIQGRVFVTFIIEADGSVNDVRILRGIGGGCDEEALRVISMMPKWIPGIQRGKPVRVQYNLPIKFTLN